MASPRQGRWHLDAGGSHCGGHTDVATRSHSAVTLQVAGHSIVPLAAFDGKACYLFWKTEDEEGIRAQVCDVQSDVLLAWKMIRARKIAEKAAETMVAEANKKDEPLKVAFPKAQVLEPPKFNWMTEGNTAFNVAQGAEISKVPELPMVGDDFMKTVFRLEAGKAGVAMNAPQTVVYVVQPIQFSPSPDVRWTLFATADFGKYAIIGETTWAAPIGHGSMNSIRTPGWNGSMAASPTFTNPQTTKTKTRKPNCRAKTRSALNATLSEAAADDAPENRAHRSTHR